MILTLNVKAGGIGRTVNALKELCNPQGTFLRSALQIVAETRQSVHYSASNGLEYINAQLRRSGVANWRNNSHSWQHSLCCSCFDGWDERWHPWHHQLIEAVMRKSWPLVCWMTGWTTVSREMNLLLPMTTPETHTLSWLNPASHSGEVYALARQALYWTNQSPILLCL